MRVRIKSKETLKSNYITYLYSDRITSNFFNWAFVSKMYKYCNKTFNLKKETFFSGKDLAYRIVEDQRIEDEDWKWQEWMFDIIKEVDKKGNFLLEFE